MAYLAFEGLAEVSYDLDNVVDMDMNEDNVAVDMFLKGVLEGFVKVETNLCSIAIACSEKRMRTSEGKSSNNMAVRKALKKLRGEREERRYSA